MKQVMEYFGGALIAMIVAGPMLGFFASLPMHLKAQVQVPAMQLEIGENAAFVESQSTPRWSVMLEEAYRIQAGVRYKVEDLVKVQDPLGANCRVRFCGGYKEGAVDTAFGLENAGTTFVCDSPGIYQVQLECESQEYGIYETVICLLVNGEG